jgi:hypothetical protein
MKTRGWKRLTMLALLAINLFGMLTSCSKKSEEPMVIEPGVGIGKVTFGISGDDVRRLLGKSDFEMRGAHQITETLAYNKLGLNIYIFKGGVDAITCIGVSGMPGFKPCKAKTSKGIGIGSTRELIIEAYGKPTSDDRNVIKYEAIGATFMVSEDGLIETMLFKQIE